LTNSKDGDLNLDNNSQISEEDSRKRLEMSSNNPEHEKWAHWTADHDNKLAELVKEHTIEHELEAVQRLLNVFINEKKAVMAEKHHEEFCRNKSESEIVERLQFLKNLSTSGHKKYPFLFQVKGNWGPDED